MTSRTALVTGRWPWLTMWIARRSGGGFGTNVLFMLTGTVLGQAASVVLSPILTRVYTPDQFGYLSVFNATLTILSVVAAAGFDLAIPLAASDSELANLLASSGFALATTTGLLTLGIMLAPAHVLQSLWLGPLAFYRPLLPIGFACLGAYYVLVATASRAGAFREIASTRLSQGLSGPISQILLGLLGAGTAGLSIGYIIGQTSGTFLLFSRVVLRIPGLRTSISWRGMARAVRRYARFPLFASWASALDMAGSGTILFLLYAAFYSRDIAGFMFLSERVIARPLLIVSTSLLQVFVGEAGKAVQNDPARLRHRFWQVVPRVFLLAAGWILVANLLADWAFPVLFGPRWVAAIPYLRASSISYLALAVLHPVSTSLQLLERQVLAVAWQVGRLVLVLGGVLIAWRCGMTALSTLWIASAAQAFACLVMLALIATSIERIQRA